MAYAQTNFNNYNIKDTNVRKLISKGHFSLNSRKNTQFCETVSFQFI